MLAEDLKVLGQRQKSLIHGPASSVSITSVSVFLILCPVRVMCIIYTHRICAVAEESQAEKTRIFYDEVEESSLTCAPDLWLPKLFSMQTVLKTPRIVVVLCSRDVQRWHPGTALEQCDQEGLPVAVMVDCVVMCGRIFRSRLLLLKGVCAPDPAVSCFSTSSNSQKCPTLAHKL